MKEQMRTWEVDVSYSRMDGQYTIMVDTGEETIYFTRKDLSDFLAMLDEADGSA